MSVIIVNTNPNNGGYAPNGAPVACSAPAGACGGTDMYEKKKKHPVLKFLLAAGLIGGGGMLIWKRVGKEALCGQLAKTLDKLSNRKINKVVRKLYKLPLFLLPSAEKAGQFLEHIRQYMPERKKSVIDTVKKYYTNAYNSKLTKVAEESCVGKK